MKKTLALLLAVLTVLGLLAGCAKEPEVTPDPANPTPTPDPANPTAKPDPANPTPAPDPVKPAEPYTYYYVRSTEETTTNPHDSGANPNINVTDRCAGMLYYYIPNEDGTAAKLVPIYAESEPTTTDGYLWTIKLRKDAKWSTGEPINADTWIYSFKMALDPNLYYGSGASIASNYITIKGATDYYNSVAKKNGATWEDVGIKKVDDYTITVECTSKYTAEEVMRQFYLRYAACVYEPLYSKCIAADGMSCDYGTALDKVKFAGMFYIDDWQKSAQIIFKKNENWPRADLIHIDTVVSRVVTDESTRLELFEKGEASHIDLGTNGMAKYGEDPRVRSYNSKTIQMLETNQNHSDPVKGPLLQDPDFRKAIFWAIDRTAIAKLVDGVATPYFLSTQGQILDDGTLYRDTPEAKALIEKNAPNNGYDTKTANEYLDKAYKKVGINDITLTLHYNETSENLRIVAEYLQSQFKTIFNNRLNLELKSTTSSVRLAMMRSSWKEGPVDTWDLSWSGWGLAAETYYPWKKFEKYTSTNNTRYTAYHNDQMDAIYAECLKEENRQSDKKLLELTVKGEQCWYDDMTCIPVYSAVSNLMYQEHVQLPMQGYTPTIGFGWYYSSKK